MPNSWLDKPLTDIINNFVGNVGNYTSDTIIDWISNILQIPNPTTISADISKEYLVSLYPDVAPNGFAGSNATHASLRDVGINVYGNILNQVFGDLNLFGIRISDLMKTKILTEAQLTYQTSNVNQVLGSLGKSVYTPVTLYDPNDIETSFASPAMFLLHNRIERATENIMYNIMERLSDNILKLIPKTVANFIGLDNIFDYIINNTRLPNWDYNVKNNMLFELMDIHNLYTPFNPRSDMYKNYYENHYNSYWDFYNDIDLNWNYFVRQGRSLVDIAGRWLGNIGNNIYSGVDNLFGGFFSSLPNTSLGHTLTKIFGSLDNLFNVNFNLNINNLTNDIFQRRITTLISTHIEISSLYGKEGHFIKTHTQTPVSYAYLTADKNMLIYKNIYDYEPVLTQWALLNLQNANSSNNNNIENIIGNVFNTTLNKSVETLVGIANIIPNTIFGSSVIEFNNISAPTSKIDELWNYDENKDDRFGLSSLGVPAKTKHPFVIRIENFYNASDYVVIKPYFKGIKESINPITSTLEKGIHRNMPIYRYEGVEAHDFGFDITLFANKPEELQEIYATLTWLAKHLTLSPKYNSAHARFLPLLRLTFGGWFNNRPCIFKGSFSPQYGSGEDLMLDLQRNTLISQEIILSLNFVMLYKENISRDSTIWDFEKFLYYDLKSRYKDDPNFNDELLSKNLPIPIGLNNEQQNANQLLNQLNDINLSESYDNFNKNPQTLEYIATYISPLSG